ncbi:branched-chain amino acid transport [Ahrensia sp. R2A130]|nr:branched-chain amino acid transport [Ahrensia sp. R2A130]
MPVRAGAAVVGFVTYVVTKQNMIAGVLVGEAILIAAYLAA